MLEPNSMNTPVSYQTLLTEEDRTALAGWLAGSGELFIDLAMPRMPGAGDWWLVRSIDQLLQLLDSVTWPQVEVTIFRQPQLPLRGVPDDDLRRRALDLIPDGQWYAIQEIVGHGPYFCRPVADGNTHAELLHDLASVEGTSIAAGLHPLETPEATTQGWPFVHSEDVFFLSVRRNHHGWPPYDTSPDPPRAWSGYAGGKLPGR